jgi:ABC-type transport system involved in cytochrome c biogenesis permease component
VSAGGETILPGGEPGRVAEPGALAGRLADRANPVLVREIQQALNSRAFAVVLGLALGGVVLVAMLAVGETAENERAGASTLAQTLYVLVPLLFVVVPIQAFVATRQEVAAGTVEHLMLSRLTPGAIVRGKLLAAAVQFVLYLAVFAPLIALTYQLRGVDVVTIASILVLTFALGLAACGFGVAGGACCRIPQIQALSFLAVIGGLVFLTVGFLGPVAFHLQFGGGWGRSVGGPMALALRLSVLVAAGLWLFSLVGASTLAHPYENRSTGFRAFAFVAVVGVPLWLVWMGSSGPASRPAALADDVAHTSAFLALFTLPFWLFAVTEEQPLSPRVRIAVPRNRFLAALSAPLLPGCGRGFLFTVLLAATALAVALALPPLLLGRSSHSDTKYAVLAWGYVLVYAGVGSAIRRHVGPGPAKNWVARALVLLVVVVGMLVPIVVDVATQGRVRQWHALHTLNPFWTVDDGDIRTAGRLIGALAVGVTVVNLRAIARGIGDVVRASRERRARAA